MILKDSAPNILVINPFGIGDCLFTTPVIREIKKNIPGCKVSYWCNERVRGIFENNPYIENIFALSRGDLKKIFRVSKIQGIKSLLSLLLRLKKNKFDLAFDFSLDHRYGLITKLLGIKRRIGFNYKNRGRFLTEKLDVEGYDSRHIVEYYLDLLKFIEIVPQDKHLDLFTSNADEIYADLLFADYGIKKDDLVIGIAPGAGASWGVDARLKHWQPENFSCLIDKINLSFNAKVILLGDASEKNISEKIVSNCRIKPLDLVGATNLKQMVALVKNLGVLITNDGGPLHIAAALGVKTVSIFGPVDDTVYGPYPSSNRHIVIKANIDCRPCYKKFRLPVCENNRKCLTLITVEQVFEGLRRLVS